MGEWEIFKQRGWWRRPNEEFDRFEDLTRRLLRVSKADLREVEVVDSPRSPSPESSGESP